MLSLQVFSMFRRRLPFFVFVPSLLVFGFSLLAGQQSSSAEQPQKKGKDGPPPTVKELMATLKAPAGFQATIFAQPPQISYPVCLVASPTGEVFIGIDENSSLDKKLGRGRIVRCRDTKGTGVADEFSEFAKVDSPRG